MATICPQLIPGAPQKWPRIHRWTLENVETAKYAVRFHLEVADQPLEMRSMQLIDTRMEAILQSNSPSSKHC